MVEFPGLRRGYEAAGGSGSSQNSGGAEGRASSGSDRSRSTANGSLLHEAILSSKDVWTFNRSDGEKDALRKVRLILETEQNINAVNHNGRTALHLVADRAYFVTVRTLLSAGADPNIPDQFGRLPIHDIGSSFFSEEASVLNFFNREFRYNIDGRNESLMRYLVSYEIDVEKILLLLVESKSDLSKRTHDGKTVIETAMEQKRWKIAHYLLDQGADYLNDDDRDSLLRIALQNNQPELVRRIRGPAITSTTDGSAKTTVIGQNSLTRLLEAKNLKRAGVTLIAAGAGLGGWLTWSSETPAIFGMFYGGLVSAFPSMILFYKSERLRYKECQDVFKRFPVISRKVMD